MEKIDIFDIKNTDDLPKELRIGHHDPFTEEIIHLFKLAEEKGLKQLNVNQVMVAYHRLFGEKNKKIKNNIQIMNKLFSIARQKNAPLEKVSGINGTYKLKK